MTNDKNEAFLSKEKASEKETNKKYFFVVDTNSKPYLEEQKEEYWEELERVELLPSEISAIKMMTRAEIVKVKWLLHGQAPYIDILEQLLEKLEKISKEAKG